MIERFGSWIGRQFAQAMAWFDHLDGWLQFIVILCFALVGVAVMHLDDLARAREWHEFKCWRESQRRPLKGLKP